ncbi:ruBisCO-associated protein-like [Abrus precatorius]|uniref:RuBisCO-associated protein-like n=1 Tax=Abrus precatorius TaxID=3816 RepID=A0A8B8K1I8_ABRPR|nr:ruBisCO-associated protein-like [Abrus precatorius]XP_027337300.1 ruBisCO-associated protein-like [Abrus precatorius]
MGFNVFRQYANDDSFSDPKTIPTCANEFQLVLAYARDYDGINSTKGKFIPYWDTEKVTPAKIKQFKHSAGRTTVKVLVSIGNNGEQFPFDCGTDTRAWITNATESLKRIIADYNLDGIDVRYDKIVPSITADDFVTCIGQLIDNLKGDKVITRASIAPNFANSDKFYVPLFRKYNSIINVVDYQCYPGFTPDPKTPVKDLEEKVGNIAKQYTTVDSFLVGYSAKQSDWATISPPLFFVAYYALQNQGTVNGSSINIVTDSASAISFPSEWILELLSMALA